MALNIDFAPTIAELAQATPERAMDGRSLTPLLVRDTPPPHNWRKDFLVEVYRVPGAPAPLNKVLRTRHEVYVEHADGFRELYDLRTDPHQLDNVFPLADRGHVKNLSERLAELLASGDESSDATSPNPAPAGVPAEQMRVNALRALAREPGQTVLDSGWEQSGHSAWDDDQSALAIVDAVQSGAR